jgi:hypothetical protein
MKRPVALASVLLAATPAFAEDPHEEPSVAEQPAATEQPAAAEQPAAPAKPTDERTAADVRDAPRPGEESGRIDEGERDSTLRNIGQGVLTVPRLVLETAFAPVRGGLYVYERYGVGGRLQRMAFDDTNTYGVYPTLYLNTDYGATFGARFVHRDMFGDREKLSLRAGFGGEFNEIVDGSVSTGERLGERTSLLLRGEFERRPQDPFHGIGNLDDPTGVRHRQQLARATAVLDVAVTDEIQARTSGALTDLDYGVAAAGPAIDVMYEGMLTGWTGTRNLYGELELRYDTRGVANDLAHHGVLLAAFAGRVHQLEAGHDYWRYGGEAIHFLPLGIGRSLATRLHVEAVTGSLEDVAFTQLPQLGGKALLRGYAQDRFRDRVAALSSAEYFWDVSRFLLASLFVDAGRVYSSFEQLEIDDHMRVGFGASLQLLSARSFVAGVSVASSIDGGLFVNLVLDPIYEPEPRVRQK